ncbi:MAG: GbsR/MarR family transcriptional regulator [Gemmatimonadota bacterium]
MAKKLTEKQCRLVERLGAYEEEIGMPPAAGRVLGLLLICPKGELTFDEIRELTGLSKGATSAAVNLLLNLEKVESVRRLGDRKRYFRSRVGDWRDQIERRIERTFILRQLLQDVLDEGGCCEQVRLALKDHVEFIAFAQERMCDILAEWERRKISAPPVAVAGDPR